MQTIEFDLEGGKQLDYLSGMLETKKINLGHESFELKIRSLHDINPILYASFLLLLVKYFIKEKNRRIHIPESDFPFCMILLTSNFILRALI